MVAITEILKLINLVKQEHEQLFFVVLFILYFLCYNIDIQKWHNKATFHYEKWL